MDRQKLLEILPPFRNYALLISGDQSVSDIMKEVVDAHYVFGGDYDKIAADFANGDTKDICEALFDFCKENIAYKVETDKEQTTRSPAATLALGYGDCKHYAGFIGGVLDALNRQGYNIDWKYRFASYKDDDTEPQHVFVVVKDKGKEYWIDPVLEYFNEREPLPSYTHDKKTKQMALHRLSGTATQSAKQLLLNAVQTLLYYGVMDAGGTISEAALMALKPELTDKIYNSISSALTAVRKSATVHGYVGNIDSAINAVLCSSPKKKVGLTTVYAVPDPIYGSSITTSTVTPGSHAPLNSAITSDTTQGGGYVSPTSPIPTTSITNNNTPVSLDQPGAIPTTLPTSQNPPTGTPGAQMPQTLMQWIEANPLIALAIGGGIVYLVTRKKKKNGKA